MSNRRIAALHLELAVALASVASIHERLAAALGGDNESIAAPRRRTRSLPDALTLELAQPVSEVGRRRAEDQLRKMGITPPKRGGDRG
jgi:uncharacterized protein (DUF2336 family)